MITRTNDERYLVLGGNGFIGSHIVDRLVKQGKVVRAIDSFRRGPQFQHPERVERVKGSAFDPLMLDVALKDVTHVIYSLSATNPFSADADPYADIDNLRKGVEILEACVRAGVKKVGFISSGGAVYGHLAEHKDASEQDMALPISPYGICKLAMEHYLEYFKKKYDLQYVVLRLTNPHGPRQVFKNGQGVVVAFIKQIVEGKEITIFGDGSASRDFIFIEDAARMIASAMTSTNTHTVYNVGSGQQTDLLAIIKNIEALLHMPAKVNFVEAPRTTLKKTRLDVTKSHTELIESKVMSIEEGIKHTVEHFKEAIRQQEPDILTPLLKKIDYTELKSY